jgi:hypothetical protein
MRALRGAVESVTVMATLLVPAIVGAPLSAPVDALRISPAGNPVPAHVFGAVPFAAANVAL